MNCFVVTCRGRRDVEILYFSPHIEVIHSVSLCHPQGVGSSHGDRTHNLLHVKQMCKSGMKNYGINAHIWTHDITVVIFVVLGFPLVYLLISNVELQYQFPLWGQ